MAGVEPAPPNRLSDSVNLLGKRRETSPRLSVQSTSFASPSRCML